MSTFVEEKIKITIRDLFKKKKDGYTNGFIGRFMELLARVAIVDALKFDPKIKIEEVRAICYTVFFELVVNEYQHMTQGNEETEVANILLSLK